MQGERVIMLGQSAKSPELTVKKPKNQDKPQAGNDGNTEIFLEKTPYQKEKNDPTNTEHQNILNV
jgi:hypothetical protein